MIVASILLHLIFFSLLFRSLTQASHPDEQTETSLPVRPDLVA